MNDIQSIQTVCTDSLVLIKVLTLLSSSSLSPFPVTSVSVTLYILFMRHGIQIFLVSPKQKMRENCHFGEESQENVASLLLLFLLVFVEYFLCVFFFFSVSSHKLFCFSLLCVHFFCCFCSSKRQSRRSRLHCRQ